MYSRAGLHIVESSLHNLTVHEKEVRLKRAVEETRLEPNDSIFEDILESYGFSLFGYGFMRVRCEVSTLGLKNGRSYAADQLQK